MSILGADSSFRQGEVAWDDADELQFAYIRAGQREDWHDSQFPRSWRMLRGKKPRGFYWVWDERDGATWEGHARGVEAVVPANDKGELPPAVDLELDPVHWDEVLRFLQWLEMWTGRRPIPYSGDWWLNAQWVLPEWLSGYDWWATGYNDVGPTVTGKFAALAPNIIIWQQSSSWRPSWCGTAIDRDYLLVPLSEVLMGKMVVKVTDLEQFIDDKAFEVPDQPVPPVPVPGGPFRLIWPAPDPKVVTQAWGKNAQHYSQFGLPGHEGIDIRAVTGAEIRAMAAGRVSRVQSVVDGGAYGIHVRVKHDHPDGTFETIYAHFKETRVALNQDVAAGELLGLADNTGNSSGAHLHITLKRIGAGSPWMNKSDITDPTSYMPDLWPGNGWRLDVGGNLRTLPDAAADLIRFLPANSIVQALDCDRAAGGDWWRIDFQGAIGWLWAVYKMRAI